MAVSILVIAAAMDAQPFGHRSQRVGGVKVARPVSGHFAPPGQRAIGLEVDESTIMHIAAFGERQLAKNALVNHVLNHQHQWLFGEYLSLDI